MRHYPAGLPPDLRNRMARGYAGRAMMGTPSFPHMRRDPSLDGWFSSAVRIVKRAASIVTAPMRLGITAPLKLLTGAARAIGVPVKGIDSRLNRMVRGDIGDATTNLMIGAGVGAAIFTGGTALPSLIPTFMSAAGQLYEASKPPKDDAPAAESSPGDLETIEAAAGNPSINAATGLPAYPGQPGYAPPKAAGMTINPYAVVAGLAAVGVIAVLLIPRRQKALP